MSKHAKLDDVPGTNLLGGCGTWSIILLITMLFGFLMVVTSCQEQAAVRQQDDRLERIANPKTALQECARRIGDAPGYEYSRSEVDETGSLRFRVVIYYSFLPADSSGRKDSLAWCDLWLRNGEHWQLANSRGL